MADIGQRAGDDDPVPTTQRADNLAGIALRQQFLLGSFGDQGRQFSHTPSPPITISWFRLRRVRGRIMTDRAGGPALAGGRCRVDGMDVVHAGTMADGPGNVPLPGNTFLKLEARMKNGEL